MASFNKVILVGNLTREPELRQFNTGGSVTEFGLASSRKFKKKDGSMDEEVLFVDCKAWGKTGEVIQQYLGKGSPILVEGRLVLERWEDREGNNRSKVLVNVESFQFLNSSPDNQKPAKQGSRKPVENDYDDDMDDDEIPF